MEIRLTLQNEIILKAFEIVKSVKNEGECGIEPIPKVQVFIDKKLNTLLMVIPIETIKSHPELNGKTIYLGFKD